jgi:HAD superfamily hydrolase (TIGR01509 family)
VVFDLDGTLVRSEHDYAALKRELGLPSRLPILEGIATYEPSAQLALLARVDGWERALAARATALEGAPEVLEALTERGVVVGIVTRNTRATALATLRAAALDRWFDESVVIGRDEAPPKPSPDGILHLVARWGLPPAEVAMVGDFRFDLEAARAASVLAVGYDPEGSGGLADLADVVVRHLTEVTRLG